MYIERGDQVVVIMAILLPYWYMYMECEAATRKSPNRGHLVGTLWTVGMAIGLSLFGFWWPATIPASLFVAAIAGDSGTKLRQKDLANEANEFISSRRTTAEDVPPQ